MDRFEVSDQSKKASIIDDITSRCKIAEIGCLTLRRELTSLLKAASDVCDMVDYQLVESGQWERLGDATDSAEYFLLAGEQSAEAWELEVMARALEEAAKKIARYSVVWSHEEGRLVIEPDDSGRHDGVEYANELRRMAATLRNQAKGKAK